MDEELIQDMTRKEAETLNAEIRASMGRSRIGVYLMHRYQGYKALGYKDFGEYCEEMIDTSRQTAYEWVSQVQATCDARGIQAKKVYDNHTNEKGLLLPTTATKELRKLPSAADRRKAWEQIEALKEHGMRTPKEYTAGLKKLVAQMLKREEKLAAPMESPEASSMPEKSQEVAKSAVTTFTPPSEKTPDTDDAQDSFPDEEPEPILHKINARTVQRDDGLKCLLISACLYNGDEIVLRVPYALLPRDMQP